MLHDKVIDDNTRELLAPRLLAPEVREFFVRAFAYYSRVLASANNIDASCAAHMIAGAAEFMDLCRRMLEKPQLPGSHVNTGTLE